MVDAVEQLRYELKARRRKRIALIAGANTILLAIAMSSLLGWQWLNIDVMWVVVIFGGAAAGGTAIKQLLSERAWSKDALGSLLEAANSDDSEIRAMAVQTVKKILPQIDSTDRDCLTAEQVRRLMSLAVEENDAQLSIEIVSAAKRMANPAAIPGLERIARGLPQFARADKDKLSTLSHLALADVRMSRANEIITAHTPPEAGLEQKLSNLG